MIAVIVAIITAILVLWALFGLWGVKTYRNGLEPDELALSDAIIAERKEHIIADGRRLHSQWQKSHPILGRLYSYKPQKYFRDNQLNTKRYPY